MSVSSTSVCCISSTELAASPYASDNCMGTDSGSSSSLNVEGKLRVDCRTGPGLEASPMHTPANRWTGRCLGTNDCTEMLT
eukprot:6470829-Amphidinium_carterae.1